MKFVLINRSSLLFRYRRFVRLHNNLILVRYILRLFVRLSTDIFPLSIYRVFDILEAYTRMNLLTCETRSCTPRDLAVTQSYNLSLRFASHECTRGRIDVHEIKELTSK